jgi:hypothetical protein
VDSGVLPAHEGATSRLSTVLWNALGGGLDDLRPEVYKARLHVGDTLLLCTDGLPEHVPDGDIHALLQARETCRQLVGAATRVLTKAIRRHGGPEKVTIDGSEANAAALRNDNAEYGTALVIRQVQIFAQHHRTGSPRSAVRDTAQVRGQIVRRRPESAGR